LKRQVQIFLTAVMFYTRIPCPAWVDHSEEYLNKATVYFPVMGWIVGGFSGLVYYAALCAFTPEIALLLSMISGIGVTGAFHEDGFADVCDGFGGGWTQLKILEIMKDSRVGAYGAIGLMLILLLKFLLLRAILPPLPVATGIGLLITVHALSRFTALTLIYTHSYAKENEDSKAKPVAKKLPLADVGAAAFFALLPLVLLTFFTQTIYYFLLVIPLGLVKWYLGSYFQKWIGGYTGDCLGATQQVAEIVSYLFFASTVWKFI